MGEGEGKYIQRKTIITLQSLRIKRNETHLSCNGTGNVMLVKVGVCTKPAHDVFKAEFTS